MPVYKCLNCGHVFEADLRTSRVRCPKCNFKILLKVRPPVVKRVKAR